MNLIQVDVIGLFDSPTNGGACALVLGEVGGKRRLPIIIGMFEGQAIDLEMKQIQPPRPLTHYPNLSLIHISEPTRPY